MAARESIRRFAGWALVGGLSLAAATAVFALLTGSIDDTDARVILTSIGFALASATASSGASFRLRVPGRLRVLGGATLVSSVVAFTLLVAGLWTNTDSWENETLWRAFGCAGVLALAGSHACLVLGARRPSDGELLRLLVAASLALGLLDTLGAVLPLADVVQDVDDSWARFFGATLVLLVLTSVLPPILRRIQPAHATAERKRSAGDGGVAQLAAEVIAATDRIEALNSGPGIRAPEIRAELNRLRSLARDFEK